MLEILSGVVAKLVGLGAAAKATAGLTAAAAAVAAAGATGVLPDLPEQADRSGVEQVVEQVEGAVEDGDALEVVEDEIEDADEIEPPEVEDGAEQDGDEGTGEPAPQASFGQSVAEDAREGGVVGSEIAEQARQQGTDRRDAAGPPADLPEQASTGIERSEAGAANGDAGRETADNAPVEQAPAGTPAEGRIPARR